jgi:hypothetical protein
MKIFRLASLLIVPAAVLAACSDHSPTAAGDPGTVAPPAQTPVASVLTCTADVQPRTVSCAAATPPSGGAVGDLLLGGQNIYVKLRSTNVQSLNGVLSADVTVQNLLARAIGTTDGVNPAASGVRVFFSADPTVTGGTGTVSIANPDGSSAFTAAGQKFYQYDGILAPGAVSAAKNWQFAVSGGVTQFVFTVYVSAPAPAESGYIKLEPQNVQIAPGATQFYSSWIVTGGGVESMNSGAMRWSISDTTVATIDASGNVTAVAPGSVVITATDGVRTGTATLFVGTVDKTAPSLTGFSISPQTVNAGDTVAFSVSASDAGTGLRAVQVTLRSPTAAQQASCTTYAPVSGTAAAGTYLCKAGIVPGARPGTWNVYSVTLIDHSSNYATLGVASRGFPSTVTVVDAAPDTVAPTLSGFSLSPRSITAGDSVTVTFTVSDAGTGVASARATLYNSASNRSSLCIATAPATGTANSGTFQCRLGTSTGAANGTWAINSVQIADRAGNGLSLDATQLTQRGYGTTVTVSGGTSDIYKPTLTSFSLSSTSVTASDSVTVTVGMADPGSGIGSIYLEVRSPAGNEINVCQSSTLASGTRANGTFVCRFGFISGAPAGTWTVNDMELTDLAGNTRTYAAGDIKGLGYPIDITVNP